jgi:hypothetical protein
MDNPKVTIQIEITDTNVHRLLALPCSELPALDMTGKIGFLAGIQELLACAETVRLSGVISARHVRSRLDISQSARSGQESLRMSAGPGGGLRARQAA